MLYMIIGIDKPNSLKDRMAVRPKHVERLNQLQAEGRLILAGPHPSIDSPDPGEAGFSGSLIVAEFDSLESARHWAEQDPYRASGVYQQITVKPFVKVFP